MYAGGIVVPSGNPESFDRHGFVPNFLIFLSIQDVCDALVRRPGVSEEPHTLKEAIAPLVTPSNR